ncbi:MAG: hypothetical protein FWC77_06940 [Defluviitaleaceae bacterium]|nr:hypothetical protein [Defluviitaleaceae bacterium]
MSSKDAKKAQDLLDDYKIIMGRKIIEVATDGSVNQLTDILNRVNNAGITISRFTQNQPSLEDAFLTLIGEKGGAQHE